jgi:hypothetical protein
MVAPCYMGSDKRGQIFVKKITAHNLSNHSAKRQCFSKIPCDRLQVARHLCRNSAVRKRWKKQGSGQQIVFFYRLSLDEELFID